MESVSVRRQEFLDHVFGLSDKVAIVTGGAGLIGSALCAGLARAGARVVVLGRRGDACMQVARRIQQEGGEAMGVSADVMDSAQLASVRERTLRDFGRIDVLVNAAGGIAGLAASRVLPTEPLFNDAFRDATRQVIDFNLMGTILPIFAFGDALADGDGGAIVNISSAAAQHVSPGVMGYSAAKAGVEQLTAWLAVEAGERYQGRLRVNAIEPGHIMGASNRGRYYGPDGTPTEEAAAILPRVPLGRLGEPADLVPALLWLCGPASSYVTGAVIPVTGALGISTGVRGV